MASTASYQIVINGIKESVAAVDSLNKQLDLLEQRLDKLATKNVNISATSAGGGNKAALDEEARMLQQIEQLHQKVAASEKEEYQQLLHAKEELKEYQAIAKSVAAQQNIDSGVNNLNTMQGMKAQLHDIKAAMQVMDVNSDKFKQFQKDANDLNSKLKEIEQGYGQFGRNVGNYANGVAEGMSKIQIKVGETTREFNNAREASRTLSMELKNMALNGQQGTKAYKDLDEAVKQMNSTLKDVSRSSVGMDRLLDTTQSLVAIASVGRGLSAIFGMDDKEIQKSLQQLMALQTALQGLETLRKQMQTQEGIFVWLTKGSKAIDSLSAKLLKVDKNAAAASKSVKMLSTSLKLIGGTVIVAAIIAITAYLDKLKKKFEEFKKSAEDNAEVVKAGAEAYARAKVELEGYRQKIVDFSGTRKQEKKLIDELNSKYGSTIGQYQTLSEWQDALIRKSPAFLQMLKNEAMAMANFNNYAKLYAEATAEEAQAEELINKAYSADVGRNSRLGRKLLKQATELQEAAKAKRKAAEENEIAGEKFIKANEELKKENGLDNYAPDVNKIKETNKKVKNEIEHNEKVIQEAQLALMRDGIGKRLIMLDEERRQRIQKIRENGKRVKEAEEAVNAQYQKMIDDEWKQFREKMQQNRDELGRDYQSTQLRTLEIFLDRYKETLERGIDAVLPTITRPFEITVPQKESGIFVWLLDIFKKLEANSDFLNKDFDLFGGIDYLQRSAKILFPDDMGDKLDRFSNFLKEAGKSANGAEKQINAFQNAARELMYLLKEDNPNAYASLFDTKSVQFDNLTENIKYSITTYEETFNELEHKYEETLNKMSDKQKQYIQHERDMQADAIEEEFDARLKAIDELYVTEGLGADEAADIEKKRLAAREEAWKTYQQQLINLALESNKKREQIEVDRVNSIQGVYKEAYSNLITITQESISRINEIYQKQPITFGRSGIINIAESRKQLKDAEKSIEFLNTHIKQQLADIEINVKMGELDRESANNLISQLNDIRANLEQTMSGINTKMQDLIPNFLKSIQIYTDAVGNAAQTLISDFGSLYDYNNQKQMEALQDINDKLEDKLSEQKDIVEKYSDEINGIEDELAESRGDRRQHLIDQLNAEIQARREAAAEQKRIENEMAENQRKMDDLDRKRRKAEYRRNLAQILISGAMAATNAYATTPFIPTGLAMGTLALALTGAQYEIAKAQKPYAKGGQLDGGKITGRRHYAGGISVLGGTANVEGGEYITNRITTSKNIDLLDFVNSKKHKINLSELIDFYQSPKARKITSRTMFANGGQLPTMPDIDLSDILTDVAIVRDNRPVVVSVTDINRKQADVRQVQALAGL